MNAEVKKEEVTLATCKNYWEDEIRIIDVNGTLYKETNGEREPMRFNVHDGGGVGEDGDILNHENLKQCGWEVSENSNRHFRGTVCLPSECFNGDIEQEEDLNEEAIQAIKDWAQDDLEEADKTTTEYLKPLEKEEIEEMFSRWLERQEEEEAEERTDEEKILDFIEDEQNDQTDFWYHNPEGLICFHDYDEVQKICREYLNT